MHLAPRLGLLFIPVWILLVESGCKRNGGTPSATQAAAPAAPAGGSATGTGSVNLTDNMLTYQDVHVQVPGNVTDPASLIRIAQEASAGRGLKLTDGVNTLQITSDGRHLSVNARDMGPLQPQDRVVLGKEGTVTVNGIPRHPVDPTTAPTRP